MGWREWRAREVRAVCLRAERRRAASSRIARLGALAAYARMGAANEPRPWRSLAQPEPVGRCAQARGVHLRPLRGGSRDRRSAGGAPVPGGTGLSSAADWHEAHFFLIQAPPFTQSILLQSAFGVPVTTSILATLCTMSGRRGIQIDLKPCKKL